MAGIAAGVYLVRKQQLFNIKAGPQTLPKNVTLTNVASDRFTVSWVTEASTYGFIQWGETEKLGKTVSDYRDQLSGETKSYTTHYVNVEGLSPSKKYFFKIGSGGTRNLYDDKGQPFQVTTGPILGTQPPTDIIYGQVTTYDKKPAEGVVVYITLANAVPVSALVGKDGMWAKPLHTTRTTDLSSYAPYDAASSVLTIKATLGLEANNNATVLVTTKNDTPVPTIVLGQDQDYRAAQVVPSPPSQLPPTIMEQEPQASPSTQPGFSELTEATPSATPSAELLITNPAEDGEEVNTQRPQILGKGPPKKVLTIKIESPESYTGTVTIDEQGSWEYTPPESLETGEHTITASYIDENGEERTTTRRFVVLATGKSQLPAFEPPSESTLSASPGTSPIPTATPSAIPSPPPRVSMPSTQEGVPKSGNIGPTFALFIFGLLFLVVGLGLQLFFKKSVHSANWMENSKQN